jgi:Domain of unknown function (DUF4279)
MTMSHIERYFKVTLHINHPTLDPDAITAALGLIPRKTHRAGEQKRTPKGELREGKYPLNHWSLRLDLKGISDLVPFLEDLLSQLETHHDFFSHLSASGGTTFLFCGIFTDSNWDESIPHQLSGRLATLKIDLRLDAYFGKQISAE